VLFQPERAALAKRVPPLVAAFVSAAVETHERHGATATGAGR
jgi:hypothetical protein